MKIIVLRTERGEGKPNADCMLFGRTLEQWVISGVRGMETESADFVLVHRGVKHRVHIERGDECVFVNGTKMTGVPSVTLGERPLDIRFFTK